jgi:hypothetical protein
LAISAVSGSPRSSPSIVLPPQLRSVSRKFAFSFFDQHFIPL